MTSMNQNKIKQAQQMLRWLTFKCKITKILFVMSLKIHTSLCPTQHTVFNLSVCSNHAPLNYSGWESKNNLQFMILTHLWPWKRSRSSNLYKLVDPKQGNHNAKFEKPHLNSVCEKKPIIKFLSNRETCQLSPLNMCKSQKLWYIHELLHKLNYHPKFQLNHIRI